MKKRQQNFYQFKICNRFKLGKYYIRVNLFGLVDFYHSYKLITTFDYKTKFGDISDVSSCIKVWDYLYHECKKYTNQPIYIEKDYVNAYYELFMKI